MKNTDTATPLFQKLLANRGLSDESEIRRFLYPSAEMDFHDPFLMRDMEKSVERIGRAIENSERIMIFGDYDVDGITGTTILMRALRKLGGNVSYRLPHRMEDGYGLREKFVREFAQLGVKVAITVDNGISCAQEADLAKELGIDLIITDHHTVPPRLPDAYTMLHPKLPGEHYPFTELTGAGVALKLAQALFSRRMKNSEDEITSLLDLACMGTIGDIGPMRGENRYIVKEGLRILENTRWPGLSRLKESAGVKGKISTHTIGFLLGPRINAAGRISHPSHAMRLLLHDEADGMKENSGVAAGLARNLEELNRKRQDMMEDLMEIAHGMAEHQRGDAAIIIASPDFHAGIIGLLAAKLSEKYSRPAIVMHDRGDSLVGSCRSVPAVNIVAALQQNQELFTHFGGHAAAAGFDLDKKNIAEMERRIKQSVGKFLKTESCAPALEMECEIAPDDISAKTLSMLEQFAPFGAGNEKPVFLLRGAKLLEKKTVGKEKTHLKITVGVNGTKVGGIGFRLGRFLRDIEGTHTLDLACEVEVDDWNGGGPQLIIRDFRAGA